jgi:hypothetical protein
MDLGNSGPLKPATGLRQRYPAVSVHRGRNRVSRDRRQGVRVSARLPTSFANVSNPSLHDRQQQQRSDPTLPNEDDSNSTQEELDNLRNEVETLRDQLSRLQREPTLPNEPDHDLEQGLPNEAERSHSLEPEDPESATDISDSNRADLEQDGEQIASDDNIQEQFEIFTKPYTPEEDELDSAPDANLPEDPFLVAFSMWCELYGITRAAYSAFIDIRCLARSDSLSLLPQAYATLKKWVYKKLPTSKIHHTMIDVDTVRLPAGQPRSDFPYVKMYHFNKLEILKSVLRNPVIKERMYFGMQRLVDREVELWESRIWGESALTTSGQCAYIPNTGFSEVILPGDNILYTDPEGATKGGRVRQVCVDHREESPIPGQQVVVVEPILGYRELPSGLQQVITEQQPQSFYLVEDTVQVVAVANVLRRANVIYADASEDYPAMERGCFRVSYVVRINELKIRDISLRHELLAQAEQRVYGRQRLLELLRPGVRVISLPTTTFIDGFTAFRKTQFSILGVYMCPANLPLRDRSSLLNQFPLTLGQSIPLHTSRI